MAVRQRLYHLSPLQNARTHMDFLAPRRSNRRPTVMRGGPWPSARAHQFSPSQVRIHSTLFTMMLRSVPQVIRYITIPYVAFIPKLRTSTYVTIPSMQGHRRVREEPLKSFSCSRQRFCRPEGNVLPALLHWRPQPLIHHARPKEVRLCSLQCKCHRTPKHCIRKHLSRATARPPTRTHRLHLAWERSRSTTTLRDHFHHHLLRTAIAEEAGGRSQSLPEVEHGRHKCLLVRKLDRKALLQANSYEPLRWVAVRAALKLLFVLLAASAPLKPCRLQASVLGDRLHVQRRYGYGDKLDAPCCVSWGRMLVHPLASGQ